MCIGNAEMRGEISGTGGRGFVIAVSIGDGICALESDRAWIEREGVASAYGAWAVMDGSIG